jgi:hypothetical protein
MPPRMRDVPVEGAGDETMQSIDAADDTGFSE